MVRRIARSMLTAAGDLAVSSAAVSLAPVSAFRTRTARASRRPAASACAWRGPSSAWMTGIVGTGPAACSELASWVAAIARETRTAAPTLDVCSGAACRGRPSVPSTMTAHRAFAAGSGVAWKVDATAKATSSVAATVAAFSDAARPGIASVVSTTTAMHHSGAVCSAAAWPASATAAMTQIARATTGAYLAAAPKGPASASGTMRVGSMPAAYSADAALAPGSAKRMASARAEHFVSWAHAHVAHASAFATVIARPATLAPSARAVRRLRPELRAMRATPCIQSLGPLA